MFGNRIAVAGEEKIQVFSGDFLAVMPLKRDALLDDPASFAKNVLAFLGGKSRQKIFEAPILIVVPMKLTPLASHKTIARKGIKIFLRTEKTVHRRRFEFTRDGRKRPRDIVADEGLLVVRVMKHPLPPNGCKRNGDEQFWIIGDAGALVRVGPGPIEDKLSIRMRLKVARCATDQFPIKLHGEMTRCPAGFRTTAAALFERQEEFMTHGGIIRIDHGVPLVGINVAHRGVCCDADPDRFIIGVSLLAGPKLRQMIVHLR